MTETETVEKNLEELLPRIIPIERLKDSIRIDDEAILWVAGGLVETIRGTGEGNILSSTYRIVPMIFNAELKLESEFSREIEPTMPIYEIYDAQLKSVEL